MIQGHFENTIVIQKSRFIADLFRVNTSEEVNQILAEIQKKYYDATHHCYAYRLNDPVEIQKANDDGEPAKTAGAPILDVLEKQEVTNVLLVVTRYFGGTLLGASGLIRAYRSSATEVLKQATFFQTQKRACFRLIASYSSYSTIQKKFNYLTIEKTSFMENVIMEVHCALLDYFKIEKDLAQWKLADVVIESYKEFSIEISIDT